MSDAHAVVLFGHGARDPEWARPMQRTRDHLRTQAPGLRVELAFLEFMTPTLEDAIAALARDGMRHITVVPMFIAQGGHLKSDVPRLLASARALHPGCEITLAPAVGEADGVIAAMARYALGCSGVASAAD
ncbi:CbiX/SirB N-terminal domain-containing protein [Aromatoleum toluolicum]|uniref:Cobalamin biosynthesis protein CbiX n=1 Tax=Aromatoleum toluolicum TaxID=90060 RepID=A0ABX1NBB0_9RHOO|nr:CbiX/SirB N-terminal domain-containing protein [Aromatoleum toluolicum]NMF96571.1 CbiX/SirB N-terminal domain-containing protein [Aromatoleum toluolicum]